MGRQMINHRGGEFQKMVLDVTDKLKKLFLTKNDVFLLTGSGTGGLEAAVVNSFSPGDKVLAVSSVLFGDRLANIAKTYGADVTLLKSEWGKAAEPAAIKAALDKDPAIKAVLVTHNETSTGVTNPLKEIAQTVKPYDKLFIVDAISSIGSIELPGGRVGRGCHGHRLAEEAGWCPPAWPWWPYPRKAGKPMRRRKYRASTGTSARPRNIWKRAARRPGRRRFRLYSR